MSCACASRAVVCFPTPFDKPEVLAVFIYQNGLNNARVGEERMLRRLQPELPTERLKVIVIVDEDKGQLSANLDRNLTNDVAFMTLGPHSVDRSIAELKGNRTASGGKPFDTNDWLTRAGGRIENILFQLSHAS